mmetsp:Transcript_62481/g.139512  ORF Transcript_62481/g.139512 Transcript_62481/m.139512 type:complete len:287 (-) Transcript_62481:893-1753(-)
MRTPHRPACVLRRVRAHSVQGRKQRALGLKTRKQAALLSGRQLFEEVLNLRLEERRSERGDARFDVLSLQPAHHLRVVLRIHLTFGRPLLDQRLSALEGQRLVSLLQLLDHVVLEHAKLDSPEEVSPGVLPRDAVADHVLRLHATSTVVQVRKSSGHGGVERKELLLPGLDVLFQLRLLGALRFGKPGIQVQKLCIQAMHGLNLLSSAVLHLHDARWLQNASTRLLIRVHLHLVWVDRRVNDHPCSTPQLAVLGDVDEDGVLVIDQGIHDHRPKLQDLVVHVAGTT